MAVEDIIWAKNRHMFGGIEPPHVKSFKAVQGLKDGKHVVKLIIELPDDLIIPSDLNTSGYDASICTIGGVIIRKGSDNYPKDEFDGELVADISVDNIPKEGYVIDENVEVDNTYTYRAFVYSTQGIVRSSLTTEIKVTDYEYFFGYDLDTTNSDPEKRVTYPLDVDNDGYAPAVLNSLNDWNIAPGTKFMPRPCMLKYDGTVGEYLDPNDYTKTIHGLNSNVANVSYEGNAMMEWPKIYTKRWEENGIYHFRCSDIKIDDDYECWCNYDNNDTEIDHFYTGIYVSTSNSGRTRSISGYNPVSMTYPTGHVEYSEKNGNGWTSERALDHFLIQDLLVMMGKSTNTQNIFGNGRAYVSGPVIYNTGYGNSNGLFYGSNYDHRTIVKVFGMEDYWGYKMRFLSDMYIPRQPTHINYSEIHVKVKSNLWHFIQLPLSVLGYISKMETRSFGRVPTAAGGSSSTYECDYISKSGPYENYSVNYVVAIGYYEYSDGSFGTVENGVFTFVCNADTSESEYQADGFSRLSCKPTKQ